MAGVTLEKGFMAAGTENEETFGAERLNLEDYYGGGRRSPPERNTNAISGRKGKELLAALLVQLLKDTMACSSE